MHAKKVFFFLIILIYGTGCSEISRVEIDENQLSAGQKAFKITTENAIYYYQKEAGGFSSIFDHNGNDWIQFKTDSLATYPESAAGAYRGLPNLVFGSEDSGAGHPGFDKCESQLSGPNQIKSISKSGHWEWTWTFFNSYAKLKIDKTNPGDAYWFLYEGPVGGKYQPQFHYWGTDKGGPYDNIPDHYLGNEIYDTWHWVYFGDETKNNLFYIIQTKSDDLVDTFSYLGNSKDGVISPDGMVVFGFGRDKGTTPLLKNSGIEFLIGFYDNPIKNIKDHRKLEEYINNLIKKSSDLN